LTWHTGHGILLRMSPFSRSLMNRKNIDYRSPGFYDPEHHSPKTNGIVVAIFCVLFGGALWISLVDTLNQQQRLHCEQGWQPACEALK
jgi:hypothetical protein